MGDEIEELREDMPDRRDERELLRDRDMRRFLEPVPRMTETVDMVVWAKPLFVKSKTLAGRSAVLEGV